LLSNQKLKLMEMTKSGNQEVSLSKSEEKRPRSSPKSGLTPMQLKILDVFKRKSKGRKELTRSKQRSLLLIRRM